MAVSFTNQSSQLWLRSLSALQDMGEEFVTGYVKLADGEKDPRNLIISFSIVRVMLIEFNITSNVDVSHSQHIRNVIQLILALRF